jgi:hypothetical protein
MHLRSARDSAPSKAQALTVGDTLNLRVIDADMARFFSK